MARRLFTAFLFSAIALSTFGEETTPDRFILQRIEVRSAQRVSPRVIVDETLLREGKEYSEDDVRAAVARLNRLPFLLSADYTLEQGVEDGQRVLVIRVMETRRLSFLIDARGVMLVDDTRSTTDYDFDRPEISNDAVDVRWFVGDRGVAHFAMAVRRGRQSFKSRYSTWELGYTHYDLFGTGAFATINLRTPVDSVNEGRYTPQIVAGIPLTTSQTLTVDYLDTSFIRQTVTILGTDFETMRAERVISLAWTYDTTDRPFVPTHGTFVRVAPLRVMGDRASFSSVPRTPAFEPLAEHVTTNGVDFAVVRYWRLSEVNSVSGGVIAGWANSENHKNSPSLSSSSERSPTYAIAQVGYSRDLSTNANGNSRLVLEGRVVNEQHDLQNPSGPSEDVQSFEASASWVRRSVWGTLRLSAGYEQRQ